MKKDKQIFDLIEQEEKRQLEGLELIASENFVSDQVLAAMGSCLTNKYAEGYPGARYYGGCQIVDQTEQLAIDRAKALFGAEYVNVQPHSGAQANAALFFGLLKMGDKFMGAIADKINAFLVADIDHPAGLIGKGLLNDPLPYCHVVTTTTHKTLRGPRGGMIMMGKDFENPWGLKTPKGEIKMMSTILNSAVFPGQQGGPLEHVIAAKAVAFGEALSDQYLKYIIQVKKNAQVMAKAFIDKGYKIVSDGTDNHLMLIDIRSKVPDITGKQVEITLGQADITINKNMVPFDSRSPYQTSGFRVGTPAVTTRGLKEKHMEIIVDMIDEVIMNIDKESVIKSVKKRVNKMVEGLPLFKS